ncbi:13151_t:CDS:2, partial [Cetraspora pellucida]
IFHKRYAKFPLLVKTSIKKLSEEYGSGVRLAEVKTSTKICYTRAPPASYLASTSNSSLQLTTTTIALLFDNTEEIHFNAIVQKKSILNNYLLSYYSKLIVAKAHYHSAWVAVTGVLCDETKEHQNKHYCLVLVKRAKQFAKAFADVLAIISQDDKSKIGLGILIVILLVYLIIQSDKTNNDIYSEQLAIFIHLQWSLETSSATYIEDLNYLISNLQYAKTLKIDNNIKPIWVLLVNRGSDENPKHLKIYSYIYNLVKRAMATLSGKLARITLPIDHFG